MPLRQRHITILLNSMKVTTSNLCEWVMCQCLSHMHRGGNFRRESVSFCDWRAYHCRCREIQIKKFVDCACQLSETHFCLLVYYTSRLSSFLEKWILCITSVISHFTVCHTHTMIRLGWSCAYVLQGCTFSCRHISAAEADYVSRNCTVRFIGGRIPIW